MLSLILIIFSMNYGSSGFLLDSSTKLPGAGNSALSDSHYIQLVDSLYEERKARQNLEVIVADLKTKVQTTIPDPIQSQTYITRLNEQDAKISHLLQELDLVKDENKNLTHQLDNIKLVTALAFNMTQMNDRQSQISNQLKQTQQTVTHLDSSMTIVKSKQRQLSYQLWKTEDSVSRNSKEVMIRVCDASTDSAALIRFNTIKESAGISNTANFTTSGKFTCEDAGLYILMVILFADNHGGYASIYKNANIIQKLETVIPNNENYYHSIPGSLALFLKIGDTIHVQETNMVIGSPSDTCLSIIKVR